ncbi:MAG: hypothetical protein AB7O50_05845 [Pseudolabrys sp.]
MANDIFTYEATDAPALPRARPFTGLLHRVWRSPEGRTVDTPSNVRVATRAMLIAFAMFALFGSQNMRHAARDLPGNAASDLLVNAADRWHNTMLALGPAHARNHARDMLDKFRMAQWPWR